MGETLYDKRPITAAALSGAACGLCGPFGWALGIAMPTALAGLGIIRGRPFVSLAGPAAFTACALAGAASWTLLSAGSAVEEATRRAALAACRSANEQPVIAATLVIARSVHAHWRLATIADEWRRSIRIPIR
ncbi:hypothetical protein HN937_28265 [Candidatus Poribacteria bacterium]|nr:hypothetical protein [Candidatus Poribacteria bacterium]